MKVAQDGTRRGGLPPLRLVRAGDGDPRHGSPSTYSNSKCRCAACRGAWAEYVGSLKEYRLRRLAADDPRHGKASTYGNWGCRCAPCTTAYSHETRARRKRAGNV